jgi:hypothetical protein
MAVLFSMKMAMRRGWCCAYMFNKFRLSDLSRELSSEIGLACDRGAKDRFLPGFIYPGNIGRTVHARCSSECGNLFVLAF